MNSLLEEIFHLEKSLLNPAVRRSPEQLDKLLADDFVEFGKFGNIYLKDDCMELDENYKEIEMHSFIIRELADGLVLASYFANDEDGFVTIRSSIWQMHNDKWKIIFHQGTPCKELNDLREK